jgi:hypothetical protein
MVGQILSSIIDMNREAREQYIIQLWKASRTVREIAGHVHMPFRDIGGYNKESKIVGVSILSKSSVIE